MFSLCVFSVKKKEAIWQNILEFRIVILEGKRGLDEFINPHVECRVATNNYFCQQFIFGLFSRLINLSFYP